MEEAPREEAPPVAPGPNEGFAGSRRPSTTSNDVAPPEPPEPPSRNLQELKKLWYRSFMRADPRQHLVDFFKAGD